MAPNSELGTSERDRLLNEYREDEETGSIGVPSRSDILRRNVQLSCLAFIVLVEIGACLQAIPMIKILEDIVCRQYYPELAYSSRSGGVDDLRCKSKEVQSELVVLRGWALTFDFLPGGPSCPTSDMFVICTELLMVTPDQVY